MLVGLVHPFVCVLVVLCPGRSVAVTSMDTCWLAGSAVLVTQLQTPAVAVAGPGSSTAPVHLPRVLFNSFFIAS